MDEEMSQEDLSRSINDSIRSFVESKSVRLSGNALAIIVKDVNYKIRQIASVANQLMKYRGRHVLTPADMNNALQWSNVPLVYGYSAPKTPSACIDRSEVNRKEVAIVDLKQYATYEIPLEKYQTSIVTGTWLATEGMAKFPSLSLLQPAGKITDESIAVNEHISDDLKVYYDLVTKAVLGNNEESYKIALSDLYKNSKISRLLPYIINFVESNICEVGGDLSQLTKLLQTIQALLSNPSFYLGYQSYLKRLIHAVLYCLIGPLSPQNITGDHWLLRDNAAQVLAKLLNDWIPSNNILYEETLRELESIFKNHRNPFFCHYGAASALLACGMKTVEEKLYPHMERYMRHLSMHLELRMENRENLPHTKEILKLQADAQKVYGLLMMVSHHLMQYRIEKVFLEDSEPTGEQVPYDNMNSSSSTHNLALSSFKMYREFYEYFGDPFVTRLPCILMEGTLCPNEPQIQLFTNDELKLSGEELLEQLCKSDDNIQVKKENCTSSSTKTQKGFTNANGDLHKSEKNYRESNNDNKRKADEVVKFKSTVSETSSGIKLRIERTTKRLKPYAKETSVKTMTAENMFRSSPLINFARPRLKVNILNGIPRELLKQRRISVSDNSDAECGYNFAELQKRLKKTGKRPAINLKLRPQSYFPVSITYMWL